MAMVVRTNINSMNANRNLSINNSQVATSLEKLASGYAINRAADDASGLAVSEKMRAQITGLDQGTENALDGVCLIQTAEGAMDEIHNMLNRMVELSTKSANGTIQDEVDREAIQAEIDVLISEIDRIAQATNYNGIPLLDGSLAESVTTETIVFESNLNIDESKSVTVGTFTITGGDLGVDFDYNTTTGQLTILSSTDMRLEIEGGNNFESIVIDDAAGSANLALKNVNITSSTGSAFYTGNNDVYIELVGENTLNGASNYAGLDVGANGSITINGDGYLSATGGNYAAGIGGSYGKTTGDILILGGTIEATGGSMGAGIGTGSGGTQNGNITITGGDVTATSGNGNAAGIGTGYNATLNGNITITGGTVNANGSGLSGSGSFGAGIGTGGTNLTTSTYYGYIYGNIVITGGDVTATGGSLSVDIGAGYKTLIDGDIIISNSANVTADNVGSSSGSFINKNYYPETDINSLLPDFDNNSDTNSGYVTSTTTTTEIVQGEGLILHVADENNPYNKIQIYVDSMRADDLGIDPLDVSTQDSAGACIDVIKNAINYVSTNRATVGALQNRLERTVNNNNNTSENMSSALSTIKDTDMAAEMMEYTKMNVLVQSAQSMLAQSNQAPQSILELLG